MSDGLDGDVRTECSFQTPTRETTHTKVHRRVAYLGNVLDLNLLNAGLTIVFSQDNTVASRTVGKESIAVAGLATSAMFSRVKVTYDTRQ